ncbi:hypothetical protein D3C78_1354940 [compost metagenome]
MRFREHVLDFQTRINVPLRHLTFLHFFNPVIGQAFTLTHAFCNFKGQSGIHSRFVNQEQHNIITTTDYRFNVAGSIFDKLLRIAEPNSCSMGQSRNLQ